MDYELIDELPPVGKVGNWKVDWEAVKALAQANPGRWVKVGILNPSVATHIRKGRYQSVSPEEFEVTTRKDGEDKTKSWLYLRTR